ncbi:Puatative phosphatidylinositol diacylglycerol-lyase [Clostridium bornimense]|uniref:1-phosphatidylinositol phosphodiesterase n=1 Tax=Clostridium bornimense TaxID=1216932 RepID=W6SJQ7_9CLOT|nr:Puatative phosphatidylinositol diacylglycerol-lyase [Clostridium bornimense]
MSIMVITFMVLFNFQVNVNAANENVKFRTNDWMKDVDGNKYLSQLSIPGTHDSGALYEPVYGTAKCQELSIDEQLKAGTRYLDIRCRIIDDAFTIHHGFVYQHLNFDDVINSCSEFLRNNPSETIIMSIKEEYKAENSTKSFEEIFDSYINKNRELWYLNDSIPTLDEVRGKIVLVRRFVSNNKKGIDASSWKDNTTFDINNSSNLAIQDCYKVGDTSEKWEEMTSLYEKASTRDDNCLYINYGSGYKSILGIPNIRKVKSYINPKIVKYFDENSKGRFGITVVDFADKDINSSIIKTNF